MNEKIRPARAVSPGRIIIRELEARGWSQQDLAEIMGRPEQMISEIVHAKKQISPETAWQLAKAFGTTPEFWLNLEMNYQLTKSAIEDKEREIERRSKLFDVAPIIEMKRRGWIHPIKNQDNLEREVLGFYRVQNMEQIPNLQFSARMSKDRGPEDRSLNAWARRVEQIAENQHSKPYLQENMMSVVDRILACTENSADISKVPSILTNNGIHFAIVPHLPRTFLDGAALWVGGHPAIGLTLRYDRIDAFWFTLLHELAHIDLHHERNYLDQIYGEEIDRGEGDELEANQTAARWLLTEDTFQDFIDVNKLRYSRKAIEQFAHEQRRHPGIVIGQLMFRKELKYSHLREYLVKVRPMLAPWEDKA